MGKGKKGGKKGKGKGKKKGGKKDKDSEMTPDEAILAYRINLKEKQLEDIRFDIKTLTDKHERDKDRNVRLSEERGAYMRMLMKQAREMEQSNETFVDKKDVIAAMKKNWEVEKEERQSLKELQKEIIRMDKKIHAVQREVDYWKSYKEKGQYEHKTQIEICTQDIVDMQSNFDAMSHYIESKFNKDKQEIETKTNAAIDRQKDLASNKAIKFLDNSSKQEVQDNEWLQKEFEIHHREMLSILGIVEKLEKENLEIMSELFECKVQDLKISKDFFITQFGENDNLEDHGILDVDLKKIFPDSWRRDGLSTHDAMQERDDETEEVFEENADSSDGTDDFEFEDELGWNDCLDIGPLELKMLHIEGRRAVIHKPYVPTAEEAEAQQWNPDVWPVNKQMLSKITSDE